MLKVTTESGTVYLVDGLRTWRSILRSLPEVLAFVPEDQWVEWRSISTPLEGEGMMMVNADHQYIRTTKVVSIEQVY